MIARRTSPGRPLRLSLSDEDRAVWVHYAATLRALPGRATAVLPPVAKAVVAIGAAAPAAPADPPAVPVRRARATTLEVGQVPAGLDRASWARLRGGHMMIDRRLDLHGHTAQHAFARFEQVLIASATAGLRCLEVITGRGRGDAGGVLRRELPLWINLAHLRPLVLAAAHPHAANPGSVLLLLSRGSHTPPRAPSPPRNRH